MIFNLFLKISRYQMNIIKLKDASSLEIENVRKKMENLISELRIEYEKSLQNVISYLF